MKFSASVLQTHAKLITEQLEDGSQSHSTTVDNGYPIMINISTRWVQHFMKTNRIVLRAETGRLIASLEKTRHIARTVAFILGELKSFFIRSFEAKELDENCSENADETNFVFNMDNGKTLGFKTDKDIKYAGVVSGREPITMIVRVTGGVNARVEVRMINFKNSNRS